MELNENQKNVLASWLSEGIGLSNIQKKLREELEVNVTFMELRFLIDDLDLQLKDKEEPAPQPQPDKTAPGAASPELLDDDEPVPFPGADAPDAKEGSVTISVDTIQRPGAVISGNVVFSDGNSASWQIDQFGQLGLIPAREGYKPSQEDIADFQIALRTELQKQGM